MKYILASNNQGKVREIKEILKDKNILSLEEIGFFDEIDEYGETFEMNALIKAQTISKKYPNDVVIADDSGLCIESLGGEPGVYTARYAKDDPLFKEDKFLACMNKTLKNMEGKENRSAFFVSVICLIKPKEEPVFFRGELNGEIAKEIHKENGFGYDPIFKYKGDFISKLSNNEKNKISHRAIALKKMKEYLN